MKKLISIFILIAVSACIVHAQQLKPYGLAASTEGSVKEIAHEIISKLSANKFSVVGEYTPANDKDRYIIVYTADELINATKQTGGLAGFAATLRVAVTNENGKILITYTNPEYWGNAYLQENFEKFSKSYQNMHDRLLVSLISCGKPVKTFFGSEDGLSITKLRSYQYMLAMPEFDDTEKLRTFNSHTEAIKTIDSRLAKSNTIKKVYKLDIPGTNSTLYGVELDGETGESKFMPIIDIGLPKHTAFLPYEFLVVGSEVHMLHGRYRIALSFPDLTMSTFAKIMSTPGEIENLIREIVK